MYPLEVLSKFEPESQKFHLKEAFIPPGSYHLVFIGVLMPGLDINIAFVEQGSLYDSQSGTGSSSNFTKHLKTTKTTALSTTPTNTFLNFDFNIKQNKYFNVNETIQNEPTILTTFNHSEDLFGYAFSSNTLYLNWELVYSLNVLQTRPKNKGSSELHVFCFYQNLYSC